MTATSAQPRGDLLWSVLVDAGSVHHRAWEQLGPAAIDGWCAAHDLDPLDVHQVTVHCYSDGSRDLEVELLTRGPDGMPIADPEDVTGRQRHVLIRSLVQSLPEGIGHVIRW